MLTFPTSLSADSVPLDRPSTGTGSRFLVVLGALLVALPWFWPILIPPRAEFLPDFVSWTVGAVLLSLLLWMRDQAARIAAAGWLAAALGNAVLAVVQYLDLENGFFPWIAQTKPGVVAGNVHQINMLATLLAVGLLSVWWMARRRHLNTLNVGWMTALLLAGLATTASRTGMVHLVAIAGLLFYWHWTDWRRVMVVMLAGVAFYLLAGWSLQWLGESMGGEEAYRAITTRFQTEVDCHSRLVLWSNVIDLIAQKPWTGWGTGGLLYAHYITLFDGARHCEKLVNAHNWPLQMAVTIGLPLTVLLHALMLWVLVRLKPWATQDATERLSWGVLLLIAIHSLLEYPIWFGVFQLMAGIAIWLLYFSRCERTVATSHGDSAAASPMPRMVGVTTCALAVLMFVGWEYLKVSQLYMPESWRLERYKEDTLAKVQGGVLYQSHVLIGQVLVTPLTRENAQLILNGALEALHTAPDSRVIRRVIESAELLGRQDLVALHTARYRAAWPDLYAEWQALRSPQNAHSSPPASPSAAPR